MVKLILVTGGLGYIGSHTVIELVNYGYNVMIIDNLSNSKLDVLDNIKKLVNNPENISFLQIDLKNFSQLESVFKFREYYGCIHFAALKSVNESIEKPITYYENNIIGTINLLKLMDKYKCYNLIFSSSATVYGNVNKPPFNEDSITGVGITNPYGFSKYVAEQLMKDLSKSNKLWNIIILRYFNPVGAHQSGIIGESPNGKPNNLFPYILETISGKRDKLVIFGDNYDTDDGTCVRDYIHVVDLANAHVKSLDKIENGISIYNVGTGKGYSVLEIYNNFCRIINKKIPMIIGDKRDGDIPICYSDNQKIFNELNWKPEFDLNKMCLDSINWLNHE